jgi:hypothetical protein
MSDQESLAVALERVANSLAAKPPPVTGLKVVASSDGKGGPVTGMKIVAVGGQGAGNVTGLKVSVTAGAEYESGIIQELRDAAKSVRSGSAPRPWIEGLLLRVKDLGDRAVDAVIGAAVSAAAKYYGGLG